MWSCFSIREFLGFSFNVELSTRHIFFISNRKDEVKNKKMIKYIIFLLIYFYIVLDYFLILVKIYMNWYGHKRLRERGKDMANSCLHILSKKNIRQHDVKTAFYYFGLSKGVCTFNNLWKKGYSQMSYILWIIWMCLVSVTMASH